MELRLLRYFTETADYGNITKAAEALHVSQPALSKQLKELEEEVGHPLFIRGARRLTLTEEGQFLLRRAKEILLLADSTKAELLENKKRVVGNVYISCETTCTFRVVAQAMKKVRSRYPEIYFHIADVDDEITMEQLERGMVDFGIVTERALERYLNSYHYLQLPNQNNLFGLLVRQDDPLAEKESVSPKTLEEIPLIVPRILLTQNHLGTWLKHSMQDLNIIGTYSTIFNACYMGDEELGYLLAIGGMSCPEDVNLRFVPLEQGFVQDKLVFIWKKDRGLSEAASKFLEVLTKDIRK